MYNYPKQIINIFIKIYNEITLLINDWNFWKQTMNEQNSDENIFNGVYNKWALQQGNALRFNNYVRYCLLANETFIN